MSETIEDIINEKRTTAREIRSRTTHQYGRELAVMLEAEADRLEAAYNYQRRDGSLCTMSCRESGELLNQYMEENKKLREENKRLRAALKPVLELGDTTDAHWPFAFLAVNAVRESQSIYEEEVTE